MHRMPSCKLLTYGALRRMMHRFEVNLKKKKAYQRKQALSKTSRQSRLERELQRKKQEAEDKRKMVMSMLAQVREMERVTERKTDRGRERERER